LLQGDEVGFRGGQIAGLEIFAKLLKFLLNLLKVALGGVVGKATGRNAG